MWKGYVCKGERRHDEAVTLGVGTVTVLIRVAECVSLALGTYIGVVSHVVDDALQHRGQCHHGVSASAVDGLVWFLKKQWEKLKINTQGKNLKINKMCKNKKKRRRKESIYIQVVTVHSIAHTSFLLGWELLLGKLEHQRLSANFISTVGD